MDMKDEDLSNAEQDKEECEAIRPVKILGGVSLNNLVNDRSSFIIKSNDYETYEEDYGFFDSVSDEEITELEEDFSKMRNLRGMPGLSTPFRSIAEKMLNVIDDGLVKKQIIKHGAGEVVPDRSMVTVHYNAYHELDELAFDSTYMKGKPFHFRLGAENVIPGLDYAVMSMKKLENSRFLISWKLGYGELGCPPRIPKKADLLYEITLLDFTRSTVTVFQSEGSEVESTDFEDGMKEAIKFHKLGNDAFHDKNFQQARKRYISAIRILTNTPLHNENQEGQVVALRTKCYINMAISSLHLNKPESACVACQHVLAADPKNIKALFTYGKATLRLSNFTEARKWLLAAKKIEPNNTAIRDELCKLDEKKKLYEKEDASFWKKALKLDTEDNSPHEEPVSVTFTEDLKASFEDLLADTNLDLITLPQHLTNEEKNISQKISSEMGLLFESSTTGNIIKKIK